MTDTNLTLVLHGKGDLRLEERPVLEPGYGEVQLQMRQVGICGSDVSIWVEGQHGGYALDGPLALGHEGSAVVIKLGPGVTSLQVGDRVAVEPATPCRLCSFCKGGRYNLCPHVKGLAMPGCDGHLTRTFVMAADFCHKVPDGVSDGEAAMAEPMAVSVQATNRGGVKMGDNIFICGAGPIGLLCMLTCRARGVNSVCISDIDERRLAFAKELGADHVINVRGKSPQDIAQEVEDSIGDKPNVTLECSGAPPSLSTAVFATRSGGVVVLVGMGATTKELPTAEASFRELDIRGTFRYANCFQPALKLMASGQVNVKPLMTHQFKLEEAVRAFETAKRGEGIKILINCEKPRNSTKREHAMNPSEALPL
ncbi:ATP-binding cassette sub-family a member 3 [Plakobranchus ocellatus]|uniref:Sorbitol dehydrogenase n=1 Tax=Plakobranchus ocellatus TaxID=259542 RepID=A0AAV3YNF1_9GAST|nr:ATP-binding cassette sub-family a member 3 [Plakobranchus ocellatus]